MLFKVIHFNSHHRFYVRNDVFNGFKCYNQSSIKKEMVTVVIDYRVAPDHPFPAAVIDTLSTIEYVIQNSKSPIHVIGQSAGGNLAAVMSLEAHRRYPGRIKR